jgi:hypothetical protein
MLLFVVIPAHAQKISIEWIKPLPNWDGRVLVWQIGDQKYALQQPVGIQISSDEHAIPRLGLVHSGYTAQDPDGKTALLNVTVETVKKPLQSTEIDSLRASGMTMDGPVQLQYGPWILDVSLGDDKSEERRIRDRIGFPRQITPGLSSIPIQVRWENISGDQLYRWLTDSKVGFKVILRSNANGIFTIRRRLILVRDRTVAWFKSMSPESDEIEWLGDATPILQSMIGYGCLEDAERPGSSLHLTDVVAEFSQLKQQLDQHVIKNGDYSSLKRSVLEQQDLVMEYELQVKVPVIIERSVWSGHALAAHPELVKDLSDDGKGIEALKKH